MGMTICPAQTGMNRKIQRAEKAAGDLRLTSGSSSICAASGRSWSGYQACERKAGELISHLEVLAQLERPGRLSPENRRRLEAGRAVVRTPGPWTR